MARGLRSSRFRTRVSMGEDVNPSAYIVNLADCMLVLACGFMVSMITYWQIDVAQVTELDESQLEEVAPEVLPEDAEEGGSYYTEVGKVYRDPNTGQLYLQEEVEDAESSGQTAAPPAAQEGAGQQAEGSAPAQGGGSPINSRMSGAD